ncbi:hypothetical protein PIB30_032116 [Stylosanthes scabra]|uniref:Protein SIEVE ELEMENT OCCLUSION B-like n=1 Tax=Stylosanthes scabra TaxID=79078 RepID=A0ABU6UAV1_9FABA|nr:hypothetical protein [Stylosanthes scabra]
MLKSYRSVLTGKKLVAQGISAVTQNILDGVSTTSDSAPNPFNEDHEPIISRNIISNHDGHHAVRRDVDSLFNVVSDIVIRRSTNFTHSLDLKKVTVDRLEVHKVPESALRPSYSLLKEIGCQMACHSFNISNADESVMAVLKKLKNYTWDAKAVIALSAFALDFGQTWRLSLTQARNQKENALDLHVFSFAEEEKNPAQSDNSTLIKNTLELIEGIIKLEKLFDDKSYNPGNVPTLFEAPRYVYTYWAVFSLFALANNQVEPVMKNKLVGRLTTALAEINANLEKINHEIEKWEDLSWRIQAFRIRSGIWLILNALIYPKNVDHFEIIASNTTNELVTLEELKTTNLFLFISGLDNIENVIESLKSVYNSITNDIDKKDYKILWVPVVENWSKEAMEKFERLKSSMPWYVLQYFKLIEGYRVLQDEWDYQGKPIVVVADAFGNVLNKNALHPISLWGMKAFPYDSFTIQSVSKNWNWFWQVLFKIHSPIQTWVKSQDKYVFFYGGSSTTWTKEFHGLVDGIKKDLELEETKTYIEHFNLGIADEKTQNDFWYNMSHSLLSYSSNANSTLLNEIQSLLALRSKEGWAIVSNGKKVFLIEDNNKVMLDVLNHFKEWRLNISGSGFQGAILDYHSKLPKPEIPGCRKFTLDNIHSRVLIPFSCSDPSCNRKMEITSTVTYNCCHGKHPSPPPPAADFIPNVNCKGPLFQYELYSGHPKNQP